MQRPDLEHVIRASAGLTGAREFVVVGSQAILGQFPDAPSEFLISAEADLITLSPPSFSDLIDGSIGEGSPFHQTFGYYAHGIEQEAVVLPAGWRDRLVSVHSPNTGEGTGLCLEVHDLAVSKLVAGREKDLVFLSGLIRHRMADVPMLRARLSQTDLDPGRRATCEAHLTRLAE